MGRQGEYVATSAVARREQMRDKAKHPLADGLGHPILLFRHSRAPTDADPARLDVSIEPNPAVAGKVDIKPVSGPIDGGDHAVGVDTGDAAHRPHRRDRQPLPRAARRHVELEVARNHDLVDEGFAQPACGPDQPREQGFLLASLDAHIGLRLAHGDDWFGNHQRFSTRSTIERSSVRPDWVTTRFESR